MSFTPTDSSGTIATCTSYALVAGTLPEGLSLNLSTGALSGTPVDGGNYTFTIACTTSGSQTAIKAFTLTISNPTPSLVTLSPAQATVGDAGLTLTLHGSGFVRSSIVDWGALYWRAGGSFGINQEAFVTLTSVATSGTEQDILLKVQDGNNPDWSKGVIEVLYNPQANGGAGAVRVETFRPNSSAWILYPNIAVNYKNGDQLGARALANGEVWIYKNSLLIAKVTLNNADQSFFNSKGGLIGLWFLNSAGAVFDDFGGGTIMP